MASSWVPSMKMSIYISQSVMDTSHSVSGLNTRAKDLLDSFSLGMQIEFGCGANGALLLAWPISKLSLKIP